MNFSPSLQCTSKHSHRESGFTLIQMAVGLVVIGIITVGMIQTYMVHMVSLAFRETNGNLAGVETAINQYFKEGNLAYPCPASLRTSSADANFGVAGDCSAANFPNIRLCTDNTWRTTDGFCKTDNSNNALIIGAVPFDALRLGFEDTLDYWGNKFLYAVTHQKTIAANFQAHAGAVRVMVMDNARDVALGVEDGVPEEKIDFTDPPDFILLSMGSSGRGAFSATGVQGLPCPTPAQGYESENCNFDGMFFLESDTIQNTGALSYAAGPTYFDDLTRYQLRVPADIWFPNFAATDHVQTMAQRVGIGTSDPDQTLHVVGNILAPNQVRSDRYCDDTNNNCFDPMSILGSDPDMSCLSGLYPDPRAVTRLGMNRVECNSAISSSGGATLDGTNSFVLNPAIFPSKDCLATGQLVVGFNASGEAICGNL